MLVIVLIASIGYYTIRISRYKSEINSKSVEVNNLNKEIADLNYNYGLSLAKIYCWSCHGFRFKTDNFLEGVVQRVGEKYLTLYLTKQDSLIAAHDPYATLLKERWGNMVNSYNFRFSPAELKGIIAFMRQDS